MFKHTSKYHQVVMVQKELEPQGSTITAWFREQYARLHNKGVLPPVYASFDVRDSGAKATVVDSNAFPSGFNNFDTRIQSLAAQLLRDFLHSISKTHEILLIPEDYTRNQHYFSNIHTLKEILTQAGYKTTLGFLGGASQDQIKRAKDTEGHILLLERIRREKNRVRTQSCAADIIIFNNDLTTGRPPIFDNDDQIILPPLLMGWYCRKKSHHFRLFNQLALDIAHLCSIDPWMLQTAFIEVDDVDLINGRGLDAIACAVDAIIDIVTRKYAEYNINEHPYVVVKDNSGTYGMGVMTAQSGEELFSLSAKKRKRMAFGKQKKAISSLLIQEGISTQYSVNGYPAEPVLYTVAGQLTGGFMRVNPTRGWRDNLNSPGMFFSPLVEGSLTSPIVRPTEGGISYYSLLCQLGNLAMSSELVEMAHLGGIS